MNIIYLKYKIYREKYEKYNKKNYIVYQSIDFSTKGCINDIKAIFPCYCLVLI